MPTVYSIIPLKLEDVLLVLNHTLTLKFIPDIPLKEKHGITYKELSNDLREKGYPIDVHTISRKLAKIPLISQ